METYNWEKINELIQPIMKVMQKEYPHNAQLVITKNFAKIEYVHTDMNFVIRGNDNEI